MSEELQPEMQPATANGSEKDGRWSKQFGDFAEDLVLHLGRGAKQALPQREFSG